MIELKEGEVPPAGGVDRPEVGGYELWLRSGVATNAPMIVSEES